jgi:hypothetical protein
VPRFGYHPTGEADSYETPLLLRRFAGEATRRLGDGSPITCLGVVLVCHY